MACLHNDIPDGSKDVVGVCSKAAETGRLVLEGRFGIHGLTAPQMAGNGLGASSTVLGVSPGMSQSNAMTMDTARLDLVNSTLQSTNEASAKGAFSNSVGDP